MKLADTPSRSAGLIISVLGVPSSPMEFLCGGAELRRAERRGACPCGQGTGRRAKEKGATRTWRPAHHRYGKLRYLPFWCICCVESLERACGSASLPEPAGVAAGVAAGAAEAL